MVLALVYLAQINEKFGRNVNKPYIKFKRFLSNKVEDFNNNKPVITVKITNYGVGATRPIKPIYEILKERYYVKVSDKNYDIIIDSVYGDPIKGLESVKDDKAIKLFYTAEAALPDLNEYDLTLAFNHIPDNPRYVRLPFYQLIWGSKLDISNNMRAEFGECNPHKKIFACFLVSNRMEGNNPYVGNNQPLDGIQARDRIFHQLSLYKKVESGGGHLNNLGRVIPRQETVQWLSQCKFIIAYENQSFDGYITEKPFQAYFSGAVPIYYGSKSAVKDLNKKAIIYAGDYTTEDELVDYIKKVDNDDKSYCDIWNQNIINDPEVNYETVKAELREKLFKILDQKLKK